MRVYAVQDCRPFYSASKLNKVKTLKNSNAVQAHPQNIAFQGNVLKGTSIGTIVGIAGLGLISFLSGGLAAPIAFGAYAATFGAIGGYTGKAIDEICEANKKETY